MDALKEPYRNSKRLFANESQKVYKPNLSLLQYRTTPQAPREKGPAEALGCPYRDLPPNLQVSVNVSRDTDQEFIQQNFLQIQEKHKLDWVQNHKLLRCS